MLVSVRPANVWMSGCCILFESCHSHPIADLIDCREHDRFTSHAVGSVMLRRRDLDVVGF
jgi:hypothetical protein